MQTNKGYGHLLTSIQCIFQIRHQEGGILFFFLLQFIIQTNGISDRQKSLNSFISFISLTFFIKDKLIFLTFRNHDFSCSFLFPRFV